MLLSVPLFFSPFQVSDDDELRVYQAHDSGIYLYRQSPNDASDDGDSDGDRDNDSNSCWKALCFVHFEQILMHSNRIRYAGETHVSYTTCCCFSAFNILKALEESNRTENQ